MRSNSLLTLCMAMLYCGAIFADTEAPGTLAIELPEDFIAIAPQKDSSDTQTNYDKYLEAYLQGLIDSKYAKYNVLVSVRNGNVVLTNLPRDQKKADKIVGFIKKVSSVTQISSSDQIDDMSVADIPTIKDRLLSKKGCSGCSGIWLPQSTVLFPTNVANPRMLCFSIGQRFHDVAAGNRGSVVTFGDQFPMYRWCNVWKWHGDLQLEIEAGVFAVFSHDTWDSPLINADYYVGVPLSYAIGPWAFRARVYHISSHLGDEYMKHHPHCHRKNKSYEAIDFFTSYQINRCWNIQGGPGVVVHSDSEMSIKPLYFEYGLEGRGFRHDFTQLYGQPFVSMYFRNYQEENFRLDATFAVGYEWGKIHNLGRKIRAFVEYHDGFSLDGQFSKKRTQCWAIRLSYGF